MSLTLYYHPLSSFCHKVLVALYENDIGFDRRIIDLGNEDDRAELLAVSPLGKFPAIRDHARNRDVAETTIIIEYLDHFFTGDLIPREWRTRSRCVCGIDSLTTIFRCPCSKSSVTAYAAPRAM